jgi:hypothetical protein
MKTPLAAACFALFDANTQQEMIKWARTTPQGEIRALLNRDTNFELPPGIFELASTNGRLSEEQARHILTGLAVMYYYAAEQIDEMGQGFWAKMFASLYGLSDAYAAQVANSIETPDYQPGFIDRFIQNFFSGVWNESSIVQSLGLSVNAGNPANDIDVAYELMLAGKAIEQQVLRASMATDRIEDGRKDTSRLSGIITQMLPALINRARNGTGDIASASELTGGHVPVVKPRYMTHKAYGAHGDLGSWLGNASNSVADFLRSPAGQQVTAVANQALSRPASPATNTQPSGPSSTMSTGPVTNTSGNATDQLLAQVAGRTLEVNLK